MDEREEDCRRVQIREVDDRRAWLGISLIVW